MTKRAYRFHSGPRGDDSDGYCGIADCPNQSHTRGWCKMHYQRFVRTGDPGEAETRHKGESFLRNGYWSHIERDHPLADSAGSVYDHRVILWDKLDRTSTSRCAYCDKLVYWFSDDRLLRANCDHVDSNRLNNDPDNLVVSCVGCNVSRAQLRV